MSWLWQYPQKAEPVLPESLRPEAPQLDKFVQPLAEPVRRPLGHLIAAALIATSGPIVPAPLSSSLDQVGYRFRNDDGNEITATWKAAENADITIDAAGDVVLRVRLEIENRGTNLRTGGFNAQRSHNAGAWATVTNGGTVLIATGSPNLTDNENTTDQLTQSATGFVAGRVDDLTGFTGIVQLPGYRHTEVEFCQKIIGADVADGDTIDIRAQSGGSNLQVYTIIARVNIKQIGAALYPVYPDRIDARENRAALVASSGPALFVGEPIVPPEQITLDKWHRALEQPYLVRPPLPAAAQQAAIADPDALIRPEAPQIDKWHRPLAEPVRTRPPLPTAAQGAALYQGAPIAPAEDITLDKWHRALEQPYLVRPPLPAAAQQAAIADPDALTRPEAPQIDKWHRPLAEPVRTRPPLPTAAQGAALYQGAPIAPPEDITPDKWHRALDEPVRPIDARAILWPSLAYQGEPIVPPAEAALDSWHRPLAEPVRVPAPLPTATQPAAIADPDALIRPEASQIDKWHRPLAEPVWTRPPLPAAAQIAALYQGAPIVPPEDITPDKWHRALDEPVRPIDARVILWPSLAYQGEPIVPPPLDTWHRPLAEPVRVPAPLPRAAHQYLAIDPDALTRPAGVSFLIDVIVLEGADGRIVLEGADGREILEGDI